jgi:RecB family exonuclease
LDMVQDAFDKSAITLRLIDYKTGKAPDLKYSASMNAKIQKEAFEQLLIYSLLLRESGASKEIPMPLRYLRLFYLTSVPAAENIPADAVYWDMDLGATQEERDVLLQSVHATMSAVWTDICNMIDRQDFKAFTGCQRSFCYCHQCRPRFVPGTVWEPED